MKEKLISEIIAAELKYYSLFAEAERLEYGIRFTDQNIPDMFCHNFLWFDGPQEKLKKAYDEEQTYRKVMGQAMLQIELFDKSPSDITVKLPGAEISEQFVMSAPLEKVAAAGSKPEAFCRLAETDEDYMRGREIDIISFGPEYAGFAGRRFDRKLPVYRDSQSGINHLVCTSNEINVGNCDLFIYEKAANVEDFDILEEFQHQGYGTSVLAYAAEISVDKGAEYMFIIVDSDNSAVEMYRKNGFEYLCSSCIINLEL